MALLVSFITPLSTTGTTLSPSDSILVSGDLQKWHPITLALTGPQADESDALNPFADYRLTVTFTNGATTFVVPGFFAADGQAAETSATSGNQWQAIFTPDATGTWTYTIDFRTGTDLAISEDPEAGTPVALDGRTGMIEVGDTDKSGEDFRGKGILRYVGEHYLRFDNGDWYLKGGLDSPESYLAYAEFDNTYAIDGDGHIKSYLTHADSWEAGDPTWQGGKGVGIIGAMNYLASHRINSMYMTLVNIGDETEEESFNSDIWPWADPEVVDRYDVSKLAQWDILFRHMTTKGIAQHLVLQELDNDKLLDDGNLGRDRKLYYREMVARFGYHNAVTWNMGEEHRDDRTTPEQRQAYIDYVSALDPYDHPVVMHTWPGGIQFDAIYGPLLGHEPFTGISFQIHESSWGTGGLKVYNFTKEWYNHSVDSGHKWVITMDECCGYNTGVHPWGDNYNLNEVRTDVLWGNLMGGGAGSEWFFGDHKNSELDYVTEDFRPYEPIYDYTNHALGFFHQYLTFWEMAPQSDLTEDEDHQVFAKPDEIYVVYLKWILFYERDYPITLDLSGASGTFTVDWFNPRMGGPLREGSVRFVDGGGTVELGQAPDFQYPDANEDDWVILLRKYDAGTMPTAKFDFVQQTNLMRYQFDASSSTGSPIVSYEWNFGDGSTGSGETAYHTYANPGTYAVELVVTHANGEVDTVGDLVSVLPAPSTPGQNISGLRGAYFDNVDGEGDAMYRYDPMINDYWGNSSPWWAAAGADDFMIRWTGMIFPEFSETYNLRVKTDEQAKLWINDQLIIDQAGDEVDASASLMMEAGGIYKIRLEVIDTAGSAYAHLFWSSPSQPEQVIPQERLMYSEGGLLPVELAAFTGVWDDDAVLLHWATASETNNAGFSIQRSIGEAPFEAIAYVKGSGTTTEPQRYQYRDATPPAAITPIRYRLKQVDFDGTAYLSEVIAVEPPAPFETVLHGNYPNPFNPATTIRYDVAREAHVRLSIYDLTGREVRILVDQSQPAGRHAIVFEAKGLASGTYFYRLQTSGHSMAKSFVLSQ